MKPPPSVQEEEQKLVQPSQPTNIQPISNEQRQQSQQHQHKQHVQHIQQIQQKQQQQQQQQQHQQPHISTAHRQQSPVSKDLRPTQSDLIPFASQAFSAGGIGGVKSPIRPSQSSFYGSPPSSSSSPLASYGISSSRTLPPPPGAGPVRDMSSSPVRMTSPAHQLSPPVESVAPIETSETEDVAESKVEL